MDAINTLFTNLLNIGTGVVLSVAAFFVMVGAFLYLTAAGSPHQMERGRNAMIHALFGMVIVVSARLIANSVLGSIAHA